MRYALTTSKFFLLNNRFRIELADLFCKRVLFVGSSGEYFSMISPSMPSRLLSRMVKKISINYQRLFFSMASFLSSSILLNLGSTSRSIRYYISSVFSASIAC